MRDWILGVERGHRRSRARFSSAVVYYNRFSGPKLLPSPCQCVIASNVHARTPTVFSCPFVRGRLPGQVRCPSPPPQTGNANSKTPILVVQACACLSPNSSVMIYRRESGVTARSRGIDRSAAENCCTPRRHVVLFFSTAIMRRGDYDVFRTLSVPPVSRPCGIVCTGCHRKNRVPE